MFYDILDKKRIDLLPFFKNFKKDFYLGGGTALALQIGHRDSFDFDFFKEGEIDTQKLFSNLEEFVKGHHILKVQEERDTLGLIIDDNVKVSFLGYKYKLIKELIHEENLDLASVEDIGCMKLSAITGRASSKDYVDLYYILQNIDLAGLLEKTSRKFPDIDRNLILKSLVYFEDVIFEPVMFKNNNYVDFDEIKKYLEEKVKRLSI